MLQSLFGNNSKLSQYIFIWTGYGVFHALSTSLLIKIPAIVIATDALSYALLFGIFGILIMSVLKYAKFSHLSYFQRIINYTSLFLLTIILTVAFNYAILYLIFGNTISSSFIAFIPLRCLIALLIYNLVVQQYRITELKETESKDAILKEEDFNLEEESFKTPQEKVEVEIIDRISVKNGTKIHVIPVSEIFYLQADSDYVHIYTKENRYLKEQTMKYFEEHLPHSLFVRIHRSCIVNIESISHIDLYEKQSQQLTLKNGSHLKVSQTGYKLLRQKMNL
jgi:hypothetical protein